MSGAARVSPGTAPAAVRISSGPTSGNGIEDPRRHRRQGRRRIADDPDDLRPALDERLAAADEVRPAQARVAGLGLGRDLEQGHAERIRAAQRTRARRAGRRSSRRTGTRPASRPGAPAWPVTGPGRTSTCHVASCVAVGIVPGDRQGVDAGRPGRAIARRERDERHGSGRPERHLPDAVGRVVGRGQPLDVGRVDRREGGQDDPDLVELGSVDLRDERARTGGRDRRDRRPARSRTRRARGRPRTGPTSGLVARPG